MFPELADRFRAVFEAEGAEGNVHVITCYRDPGQNLRTQFERYIEAAGLKPWPKFFQNLRASRATELAHRFPSHPAAAWLGHSEKIADAFYRTVTDEHFRRACADSEKAAQKPAQQPHAGQRNQAHPDQRTPICEKIQGLANQRVREMGVTGLEPVTSSVSCWRASQLRQTPVIRRRQSPKLPRHKPDYSRSSSPGKPPDNPTSTSDLPRRLPKQTTRPRLAFVPPRP